MSVNKRFCGPCLDENKENVGVMYCINCIEPLCDSCKQDHVRIKALKHHKLCDLTDLPLPDILDLIKSLTACPNHENEEVVYLCKDHDVTCCSKCAMAEHRKCEEIKVLSDIQHDKTYDCSGLRTALQEMQQQCERLLENEDKYEELIAETESQVKSLLQDVQQNLLKRFCQLENEVLTSMECKKNVLIETTNAHKEKLCQFLNDIKKQSSYIEHITHFGREDLVALMQRKIEKEALPLLKLSVVEFDKLRSRSFFKCTETMNVEMLLLEIRNYLRIEDVIYDISETGSDTDVSQSTSCPERKPQLQTTIGLNEMQLIDKLDGTKDYTPNTCIWIDNHIVLSFTKLQFLLVVDVDTLNLLSKFHLQSKPGSVSKIGPTDIVISLPYDYKICFAQLRHGNVHLFWEIATRIPYHGITKDTSLNQYICMSTTKGQIDILNNDGSLLRGLSLNSEVIECVKSAHYIAYNKTTRALFLPRCFSNRMTIIGISGEKAFDYKNKGLRSPKQCAFDPRGNVYVTSNKGEIQQISPTGKYRRSLLAGEIDTPCGLCFNDRFDKFAIIGGSDNHYYLRVYTYI